MKLQSILLFALLIAGCISGSNAPKTSPAPAVDTVEVGDLVKVNYIGTLKDTGELFDTSYEEIARNASITKFESFMLRDEYEPLSFVVGSSNLLPVFEEAILGLKVGGKKTITLSPEDAYGDVDPGLIEAQPRDFEFQKVKTVPLEEYIRVKGNPVIGDVISTNPYWDAKITNVTNDTVFIEENPINNLDINTSYGPAKVIVNDTSIFIRLFPEINSTVLSNFGPGKVLDVNETSLTVDFNHPLAGKTLVFQIFVAEITKGELLEGLSE